MIEHKVEEKPPPKSKKRKQGEHEVDIGDGGSLMIVNQDQPDNVAKPQPGTQAP